MCHFKIKNSYKVEAAQDLTGDRPTNTPNHQTTTHKKGTFSWQQYKLEIYTNSQKKSTYSETHTFQTNLNDGIEIIKFPRLIP